MTDRHGSFNKTGLRTLTLHFATTTPTLEKALCRNHKTPGLWDGGHDHQVGTKCPPNCPERRAKDICRRCPEAEPCLLWALTDTTQEGIAGATNWRERNQLRSKKAA